MQDSEYECVGENPTRHVDVRPVAATNCDVARQGRMHRERATARAGVAALGARPRAGHIDTAGRVPEVVRLQALRDVEYEMVLVKQPNRYRAMAGALQAPESAGDKKKALLATRVIEQTATADSARPEVAQARRLLGK